MFMTVNEFRAVYDMKPLESGDVILNQVVVATMVLNPQRHQRSLKMPNQSKTFTVPQAVRNAAKRGLELRKEHGRGGLDTHQAKKEGVGSGVQRASNLIQGKVSYATVKRMLAFFRRHEKNKNSKMPNGEPGAGRIAWLLWGGDAGFAWAKRIVKQEEKVEKGSFLASVYFGDDYPEDETPETIEESQEVSFSGLIKATRR